MIEEMQCHEDVMKFLGIAERQHAWDFIFSEGDTILDKYLVLLENIRCCCVRKKDSQNIAYVVCNKGLSTAISVSQRFDTWDPRYKTVNDLMFVGNFPKDCGPNGYKSDFCLYEDTNIDQDKILVKVGPKISVINVFNYVG